MRKQRDIPRTQGLELEGGSPLNLTQASTEVEDSSSRGSSASTGDLLLSPTKGEEELRFPALKRTGLFGCAHMVDAEHKSALNFQKRKKKTC